jgi:hypothetical protein
MLNLNVIEPPATRLSASINNAEKTAAGTTKLDDATSMPSNRQTTYGVKSLTQVEKKRPESSSLNLPMIRSRRGAPSAITTENYFSAKAMLSEVYVHNIASIKREYISNTLEDAPHFRKSFEVFA